MNGPGERSLNKQLQEGIVLYPANCHIICGTVNSACRFNDPLFFLNFFLKKMKENSLLRSYNRMDSIHYLNLVLQVNHSDLL